MKQTLLDRFFIWANGDPKVLIRLALLPVFIIFAFVFADSPIGETVALGSIVLDSQMKINALASFFWGMAAFALAEAFRFKKGWIEYLALVAAFSIAFMVLM